MSLEKGLFDFHHCLTVQVKSEIYAIKSCYRNPLEDDDFIDFTQEVSFLRYSKIESANPSVTTLKVPHVTFPGQAAPRIVNFKDQALYMIGAMYSRASERSGSSLKPPSSGVRAKNLLFLLIKFVFGFNICLFYVDITHWKQRTRGSL